VNWLLGRGSELCLCLCLFLSARFEATVNRQQAAVTRAIATKTPVPVANLMSMAILSRHIGKFGFEPDPLHLCE
jgi:hypothetical protein